MRNRGSGSKSRQQAFTFFNYFFDFLRLVLSRVFKARTNLNLQIINFCCVQCRLAPVITIDSTVCKPRYSVLQFRNFTLHFLPTSEAFVLSCAPINHDSLSFWKLLGLGIRPILYYIPIFVLT